jgi:prolipoprotein diacylglyceryltransferase
MITTIHFSAAVATQIHFVFEWLAMLIAVQIYRGLKRRKGEKTLTDHRTFAVLLSCIIGAGIGNKLLFAIEYPPLWASQGWAILFQGQSIVGGLIGGLIGVEVSKKIWGVKHSTGDDFILPLIVGTIIGRIGCFLAGLQDGTFGLSTQLPWGIDFGDGIFRHPTQLYDMLAVSSIGLLLWNARARLSQVSGLAFKLYLASYLIWRLFIDQLKPVPYAYGFGLSGIQWVAIMALLVYLPLVIRDWRKTNSNLLLPH